MSKFKRMGAAVAVLTTALAGLALVIGAGAASAGRCNDEAFGDDVWITAIDAGPVGLFAGVDQGADPSSTGFSGAAVCWGAPDDAEPHQVAAAEFGDPANKPGPGLVVAARRCDTSETSCAYLVEPVGVNLGTPGLSVNEPGGPDGVGATVTHAGDTCTYVNSAVPGCIGTVPLANATFISGDGPDYETSSTCLNVNGECKAELVNGAAVEVGDSIADTLTVGVLGSGQDVDVPYNCVKFNAECD